MATIYKIHPAIGIARVGNSPNEFFVGPERRWEQPEPQGGFKDAQCRVKRQAARFYIFAHHDDGTVEEINDDNAEITWTVHLANRKAAYPGRGNSEPASDLVIDPGSRSTSGPNQQKLFDNGSIHFSGEPAVTVPLGEIRSDSDNHLLVMGGFGKAASPAGNAIGSFWGNAGWYDDISDGPVSATIKLRSDNSTPAVVGAWVIVAPPKFAPHQDSATTLYDRIQQAMVSAGLATAPATTSYTNDVYPILQRARDIRWVFNTSAHTTWVDPVTATAERNAIFSRLNPPPGSMPALNGSDRELTAIQHDHMQRWNNNAYNNDWSGVPTPSSQIVPDELDRAVLDAAVGAAFYPGIEAGGKDASNRPILNSANYAEAFRINHATVLPGTISASMALPWHADFNACSTNWWPVPRPNSVIPQGTSSYQSWSRGVGNYEDMVAKWASLGFVVKQGNQHVEVDRCDTATITLLTPYLHFVDVPQGPMGMVREVPLAITFEVITPNNAVTLEFAPGGAPSHSQLVAANTSVTVGPTGSSSVATARLWIIYRTGMAPSAIPTQTVTVREPVSGQTWDIAIDANTVARETAAVALVLDRSGSMSDDRGDGISKHVALQQAAQTFVEVMLEGDGVGIVRYNQDAQVLQPVKQLGNGMLSDTNRNDTINTILGNGLDPNGATSIGDGIFEGRQILNGASGYTNKSLVVLTDGVENQPRWISDVAPEIDAYTYSIGLGTPQNTSAPALQSISGNHGGYLLVTGAIAGDNRFLLQKYFLQILAGVSNADVVLDPDGELIPGAVHRIPFRLTEADAGMEVILLSPYAKAVDFRLQTPGGLLLEPWRAMSEPGMQWSLGNDVSFYRIALPTQLIAGRYDQGGTWHALLTIGSPRTKPHPDDAEQHVDFSILRGLNASAAQRARQARATTLPIEEQRRVAAVREAAGFGVAMPATTGSSDRTGGQGRRTVPYSLVVHSYSNLSFNATLSQSGWEPGAQVKLRATLVQSGLPIETAASVWAEWVRPDGTQGTVTLERTEPGIYQGTMTAAQVGVHRLRVRATGKTRNGLPFTRERTLTAAVWHGGDRDAASGHGDGLIDELRDRDERWCKMLECLLTRGGVIEPELEKRLRASGIDLDHLRKCLSVRCRDKDKPRSGEDR